MRGGGTYETIVGNIRRVLSKQRVYVSFVMMESNIGQMQEFVKIVAGLGVREIGFQHEIYCLPGDIEASRRQFGWTAQDEIMMTVKERDWTPDSLKRLSDNLAAMATLERIWRLSAAGAAN